MLEWVTDGGLDTDPMFHRGMDLPEFAAFPLVDSEAGAGMLNLLCTTTAQLLAAVPPITTLGGCCGTDATHVAALWRHLRPTG